VPHNNGLSIFLYKNEGLEGVFNTMLPNSQSDVIRSMENRCKIESIERILITLKVPMFSLLCFPPKL
jgi:hypothetical protein